MKNRNNTSSCVELDLSPEGKFKKWFEKPIREIEKMPNGDGNFMAVGFCCALYERYVSALYKRDNRNFKDTISIVNQLQIDFRVDKKTSCKFWSMMRVGILHQGMPKVRDRGIEDTYYCWSSGSKKPFEIGAIKLVGEKDYKPCLHVNPHLFIDRVLKLCVNNLNLIDQNKSFPLPNMRRIVIEDKSQS